MKIYLSAPTRRQEEMRGYRDQLRALKHVVLGSWIDDPEMHAAADVPADGGGLDPSKPSDMSFRGHDGMKSRNELEMAVRAARVYTEILECDTLVVFTDGMNHTREASYGEYVGALFKKKRVCLVGARYHTMHFYVDVEQFSTWAEFLAMLAGAEEVKRILSERQDNEQGNEEGKRG